MIGIERIQYSECTKPHTRMVESGGRVYPIFRPGRATITAFTCQNCTWTMRTTLLLKEDETWSTNCPWCGRHIQFSYQDVCEHGTPKEEPHGPRP